MFISVPYYTGYLKIKVDPNLDNYPHAVVIDRTRCVAASRLGVHRLFLPSGDLRPSASTRSSLNMLYP